MLTESPSHYALTLIGLMAGLALTAPVAAGMADVQWVSVAEVVERALAPARLVATGAKAP